MFALKAGVKQVLGIIFELYKKSQDNVPVEAVGRKAFRQRLQELVEHPGFDAFFAPWS